MRSAAADLRGLGRVVDAGPDRRDVVRADHARGELRVAQFLRRLDGRHPVFAGRFEAAAARHREVAQQAHRRVQPGAGSCRHGPVIGGGGPCPYPLRRVTGPGRRGVEVGGLAEDVRLQVAKARAGIQAELLDQERAGPAQDRERVALTAGAVEREGEEPPGVLAPGVLGHVCVEVRHRVGGAAQGEACLRPAFDGVQAQLAQAERSARAQASSVKSA